MSRGGRPPRRKRKQPTARDAARAFVKEAPPEILVAMLWTLAREGLDDQTPTEQAALDWCVGKGYVTISGADGEITAAGLDACTARLADSMAKAI